MIQQFITEMYRYVPPEARVMYTQFRGDPEVDGRWAVKPLPRRPALDPAANVYVTVSAMRRNSRGEWRRRKENFVGGILLMVDDLGSGPGAKFPLSAIAHTPPTALVETSPDNYQAIYMFDRLLTDREKFAALIRAFIARQFLGQDTGMAGVNRVFRPPVGVNGKAKYGGRWAVRCARWAPERRYAPEELAERFSLDLSPPVRRAPRGATREKSESIRAFVDTRAALRAAGLLKGEEPNIEGWTDVHCPWRGEHTGGRDDGAAIREPAEENDWCGAFRCHHGACAGRGWRQLTEWLAAEQAEVLELINRNAGEWNDGR